MEIEIELELLNSDKKALVSLCSLDKILAISELWSVDKKGYVYKSIRSYGKTQTLLLHRIITDCPTYLVVHHKDNNPLNNTINNLMVTSNALNTAFQKKKKGKSKYKGVYWKKDRNKWQVMISVNNKRIIGKHFENEDEAGKQAAELYKKYGGSAI